jgi:biotin synthase-related radical SAM superfamily protein
LTLLENDINVCIYNVGRNVICIDVTRYGNTIRNSIIMNKQRLERVSSEYAESLTKFIEEFKKYNIPPEQAKPIQNSIYEFTKEVEDINPDEKVSIVKQKNVNSKFSIFPEKALYMLPKTAETVSAFRQLVRFSKLMGKGARQLTYAIQNQKLLILYG